MANINTDFLRFSAYSIKELITRKLAENSKFTDEIYEGSNLATLIDLVSYMYQCLLLALNNSASESMFSDTQIYENINRLINMIGYHAKGYTPSTLIAQLFPNENSSIANRNILPFSCIKTGLTDQDGKEICFSTTYSPNYKNGYNIATNGSTTLNLVNGKWKLYGTVFTANGTDYETFLLDGLKSDSENKQYIANNIEIYVGTTKENKPVLEKWYRDENELFVQAYSQKQENRYSDTATPENNSLLYTPDYRIYSVRLNEDKTYEIKFGNGVTGQKLRNGDRIYVMYLDTNGPGGKIELNDINQDQLVIQHNPQLFGITNDDKGSPYGSLYKAMFGDEAESNIGFNPTPDEKPYSLVVSHGSTTPSPEESVEDIREKAPSWFKTGNRLITKMDYEYYMKNCPEMNQFKIIDAKCMNNWDYMTTFYRWLYNLGRNSKKEASPYKYLQKQRLTQQGYEYVDSADANNVYLWLKMENDDEDNIKFVKESFDKNANEIKTMTTETYIQKPVPVIYDISFTPDDLFYKKLVENETSHFDTDYSYLEITMSDNSLYNSTIIRNNIAKIIIDQFSPFKNKLGTKVDYQSIMNRIYEINGVERVRTVFYINPENITDDLKDYASRYCDGISFASWTKSSLIDIGEDLTISNTSRNIEQFQFPEFAYSDTTSLANKIKVIRKSMDNSNPVKF